MGDCKAQSELKKVIFWRRRSGLGWGNQNTVKSRSHATALSILRD